MKPWRVCLQGFDWSRLIDKGMLDVAKMNDEEMFAKGLSAKPREELIGDEASARRIGRWIVIQACLLILKMILTSPCSIVTK